MSISKFQKSENKKEGGNNGMFEKDKKHILTLDKYEHGIMVNAVNLLRTDLIAKHRPTDAVDELLIKTIKAPVRGVSKANEAR